MNRTILPAVLFLLSFNASAEPLKNLAGRLEKTIMSQKGIKIAVMEFPYSDGASNSGSSIIQERLTTYLAQSGKIAVVERKLLKKVLEEMKLDYSGITQADNTKQLGKLLGAGALVAGTLNDLDAKKTEINARVIDAESGKILAAEQAVIKRTWTDAPVKPRHVFSQPSPSTAPQSGNFLGKPLVQIALLLDTSNSMDGLINQAKNQLWKIVNELSASEKSGNNPEIEVALYEYGNDAVPSGYGHTRQVLDFTGDLDKISEQLFSLKTNGGNEYCGYAIDEAVKKLKWDAHDDVYRAIFIAGNEPFTQGPVDFRNSSAQAVKRGIFINTIYCGGRQEGIATQWKAGADSGYGEYSYIDQSAPAVSIHAPQDDELARLGTELNQTYIAYGAEGITAKKRQARMDASASFSGQAVMASRAVAKASPQYSKPAWDLAESASAGAVNASEIKDADLPAEMRSMNKKERSEYLASQLEKRKKIQTHIRELNAEREQYVRQRQKETAASAPTLDKAVINAVRSQAVKKGFIFKN